VTPVVEARRELRRRSQLELIQCLVRKLELKLESESEQGLEHSSHKAGLLLRG
jgi:hypothetical protein